jgi:hypothetical protein
LAGAGADGQGGVGNEVGGADGAGHGWQRRRSARDDRGEGNGGAWRGAAGPGVRPGAKRVRRTRARAGWMGMVGDGNSGLTESRREKTE